ncbi:MAG TPA: M28 family peptidase, partial [Candidatus Thermoplasmatota archaeon]|nr:M28 family peptidase [Candidatus Thermoplasmatota archaeon]
MRGFLSLTVLLALAAPLAAAESLPTPPSALGSDFSPAPDETAFANDTDETRKFVEAAMNEIKGENVYRCIEEVTQTPPTMYRLMGTPTHDQFVAKYAKVFSSISPRIKDQVVRIPLGGLAGQSAVRPGGDNIIGVLPGANLTNWVVMGGHYDNREGTVGAIDNTSGICTVKELARAAIALDLQPQATLVFGWWDGEEWGLYGSTSFVRDHSATKELLGLAKDTPVRIMVGQSWDIVGINYPAYNTWIGWGDPANPNEYANLNLRTAPTDVERSKRLYGRLN